MLLLGNFQEMLVSAVKLNMLYLLYCFDIKLCSITFYSIHFRRLAGRILARVDALASTTIRLVDVLFHGSRDFISYEIDFKPQDGSLEYVQVMYRQCY